MGCSFFAHGPLVVFSADAVPSQGRKPKLPCKKLLEKVAPASLKSSIQSLADGQNIDVSVRAGLKDGDVQLGARFELRQEAKTANRPRKEKAKEKEKEKETIDLQAMAVDLAFGKEKIFDAFMVERTRQMFASMGADTVVSAIECRANDMALVTLSVTPIESSRQIKVF